MHQAVEAKHQKDGVQIKQETQTIATVTLQNFFKLYKKLAGMTGTAMTEETEFWKIYKLDVSPSRPNSAAAARQSQATSFTAPRTRSGTRSSARSRRRTSPAGRAHRHQGRGQEREALGACSSAAASSTSCSTPSRRTSAARRRSSPRPGALGSVTISTNMAGRGTDIILGGNPETLAWARSKQLKDADGRPLYPTRLEMPNDVWATTIHESRARRR